MNQGGWLRGLRAAVAFAVLVGVAIVPVAAQLGDSGHGALASSIGYASSTICTSADLPPGFPRPPPGHWFNPDRVGQGWSILRWQGDNGEFQLKLIWYTYHPDRLGQNGQPYRDGRPLWLETDVLPFEPGNRWSGTVYKQTASSRIPFGEVSLQLTSYAQAVAVRWKRNDITQYPPIGTNTSPAYVEECIKDIFREFALNEPGGRGGSLMYSGLWEEQNNPAGRRLVIERGQTREPASQALEQTQLLFPLMYDAGGEPVWLYGQYGPKVGEHMPSQLTYTASNAAPDAQLAYNFLTYPSPGHNQPSGPQYLCSNLTTCLERLQPPPVDSGLSAYPFSVMVDFAASPNPDGPGKVRVRLGDHDGGVLPIRRPLSGGGDETYSLQAWRRPASGNETVPIIKLNPYTSIQVDRYQCTPPAGGSSCPIQVNWSATMQPHVSVWRMSLMGGASVRLSNGLPFGSVGDSLPAGSRVRYRLVAGSESGGTILDETPEVRAHGEVADALVVQLPVPNHDLSVGALPGSAGVSGGAATYEIPIQLAPGRNGMQPNLALVYSSRSGNGIAGLGWSLSGLSSIHRCPQTVAQDGRNTAVDYTVNDRLCLDGRRLMLASGFYGLSGAVYRTEIDDFARVSQFGSIAAGGTAYFRVEHKNGLIDWYGACQNGGCVPELGRHTPEGAPAPLSWAMVSREDRFGNTIRYEYAHAGLGEYLISRIRYTGHQATVGTRLVDFQYESRGVGGGTDISSSYLRDGLTMQRHRLTRVRAWAPADQAPNTPLSLVRTYELDYGAKSSHSDRSVLRAVRLCPGNAAQTNPTLCKKPTIFDWQDAVPAFDLKPLDVSPLLPSPTPLRWPQVERDQDPYAVLLRELQLERVPPDQRAAFEAGELDEFLPQSVESALSVFHPLADVTGDGAVDWYTRVRIGEGEHQSYLIRFTPDRQLAGVHPLGDLDLAFRRGLGGPVDINNDGKAELLVRRNNVIAFGFWNGNGFNYHDTSIPSPISLNYSGGDVLHVQDFDGDGKPDVLATYPASVFTQPAHGCATGQRVVVLYRNTSPDGPTTQPQFASVPQPVTCLAQFSPGEGVVWESIERVSDFDGNGLPDLFIQRPVSASGMHRLHRVLLTQSQAGAAPTFVVRNADALGPNLRDTDLMRGAATTITYWADVNGDGLDDLVIGGSLDAGVSGNWKVRLNRGGTLGPSITVTGAHAGAGLQWDQTPGAPDSGRLRHPSLLRLSDVDGDGRPNLLIPSGFALRACVPITVNPGDPRGVPGTNTYCPERPGANPDLPGSGLGDVFGMYEFGHGHRDVSIYTMSALRFVQTGAAAFELRQTPITGLLSRPVTSGERLWTGDVYGDGLPDVLIQIGTDYPLPMEFFAPNDFGDCLPTRRRLEEGVCDFPTGQFGDPAHRKVFIAESRGAGRRAAGLPPYAPELMHYVKDGLDREAKWEYFPLSSNAGRSPGPSWVLPFYARGSYVDADHFYFTSSMNVVESFAYSNGIDDHIRHHEYSYREAMYNNKGRGFQGFRAIVEDVYPGGTTPQRTLTTYPRSFRSPGWPNARNCAPRSRTRLAPRWHRLNAPAATG